MFSRVFDGGRDVTTVDLVIDNLVSDGVVAPRHLKSCTRAEIEPVRVDQDLPLLPPEFVPYLERMGRRAGHVLVGSSAFHPDILRVKQASGELLEESGVQLTLGPEALVVAMHQGYQFFWIPSVLATESEVLMFQEGDQGPRRSWPNFAEYLNTMAQEI
jgi:hypothetical protein